jgi:hypothetical protein
MPSAVSLMRTNDARGPNDRHVIFTDLQDGLVAIVELTSRDAVARDPLNFALMFFYTVIVS